jgi:hypothetical protein
VPAGCQAHLAHELGVERLPRGVARTLDQRVRRAPSGGFPFDVEDLRVNEAGCATK